MNRETFDSDVAYARQSFEEGLIKAGFAHADNGWTGAVKHRDGVTDVVITLPTTFPFRPPRVAPVDEDSASWSWHRELDGALCLVADDDRNDLWWADSRTFLGHAAAWFDAAGDNWPDDTPDLHLERYFYPASDQRLYLYGELDDFLGDIVRFAPRRATHLPRSAECMVIKDRRRKPQRKSKYGRRDKYSYVVHFGEIAAPPRGWADVSKYLDPSARAFVESGQIDFLTVVYARDGTQGVVLLEVQKDSGGAVALRRLRAAADTPAARSARSGPNAVALRERSVAVVGVGALGSFVADILCRAGVGRLSLCDDDIVLPGNVIRHLVGPEHVGMLKTVAVKQHLIHNYKIDPNQVATVDAVSDGATALTLFDNHDLVINCTADFGTTALLGASARCAHASMVSVAIQNDGSTFRIDLIPPLNGAEPLADTARPLKNSDGCYREAGCGDVISPTSPQTVIEAGAATVRHAVALLHDQPLDPAGESRDVAAPA